ncbi:WD repeat-containing protein 78 [Nephila pilipes]|uniref:Dynein axonemal intermediate chain 4 n=1 Tax=Nephila pilipes TaxID=299642 RepID=A0A8X6Q8F7_NEPPI|nr:WD repeat-containing protein 78 [Nephila pilipes]
MTTKDIILEWLEEGFSCIEDARKKKVSDKSSLIPTVTNDFDEIVTPKPLFPIFFEENIELETNFLVEYLEVIENMLRKGIDKSKRMSDLKSKDVEISPDIKHKKRVPIEYERKNIFLSRIVFSVFDIPDSLVAKTSPQYDKVLLRNDLYKKAFKVHQDLPEFFQDQSTQEGYTERENKSVETLPIVPKNIETLVNSYKMKEHYDAKEVIVKPPPKTLLEYMNSKTKFRNYKEFLEKMPEHPSVLNRIRNSLYVMEKSLNYNTYKNTFLSYNDCKTDLEDFLLSSGKIESKSASELELRGSEESVGRQSNIGFKHHLQFTLPSLQNDYRATCIECNLKNPSIFICGYGVLPSKEIDTSPRGIVLCWNIHKCEHPERIYHTEEAVECVEFSKSRPYLIAVGMRYGLLAVFDLRKTESRSSVNNRHCSSRPSGTIMNARWIRKKYSLGTESELLLTVSLDGLLTSWSLGKTLTGSVLRSIKRGEDFNKEQKRLFLATDAAGMCLQMKPDDSNIFVVGTIEGQALLGEFNDPEDYTRVYNCHNGPLYDLQWSPVVNDTFMTCGVDRRVVIWDIHRAKTSKTIFLTDIALRLALSNVKSTLFVVLTQKVIYIYDIAINLHKPLIELPAKKDNCFTCVVFCSKNDWILVGASNGDINLYELTDVTEPSEDQAKTLKDTLLPEY